MVNIYDSTSCILQQHIIYGDCNDKLELIHLAESPVEVYDHIVIFPIHARINHSKHDTLTQCWFNVGPSSQH